MTLLRMRDKSKLDGKLCTLNLTEIRIEVKQIEMFSIRSHRATVLKYRTVSIIPGKGSKNKTVINT